MIGRSLVGAPRLNQRLLAAQACHRKVCLAANLARYFVARDGLLRICYHVQLAASSSTTPSASPSQSCEVVARSSLMAQEPIIPQAMALSTSLRVAWGAMPCTCPECTQEVADLVLKAYAQEKTWTPGSAVEVGRGISSTVGSCGVGKICTNFGGPSPCFPYTGTVSQQVRRAQLGGGGRTFQRVSVRTCVGLVSTHTTAPMGAPRWQIVGKLAHIIPLPVKGVLLQNTRAG